MAEEAFRKQLDGYRLATAEILYRMPDHPALLQSYLWQDYDIAPKYPVLTKFLDFWRSELDGALHSVRIGQTRVVSAAEIRSGALFAVH